MKLLREALSFSAVGLFATLTHVTTALALIDLTRSNPYSANLLGTGMAFMVSFLGNAGFTFRTDRSLWICARRYLCVSLFSFVATSAILALVRRYELPTYAYALIVFAVVPPTTFLLVKFWAFSTIGHPTDYIVRLKSRSDI